MKERNPDDGLRIDTLGDLMKEEAGLTRKIWTTEEEAALWKLYPDRLCQTHDQ